MNEHKCLHETDLAVMAQCVEQTAEKIDKVLVLLQGDNGKGLVTRVNLLEAGAKIRWWWVGGLSLAMAFGIVKMFFL